MTNKQHKIFKISTTRLSNANWDLKLSYKEASELEENISLFDSQATRLICHIADNKNINTLEYIVAIIIDKKSDFKKVCNKNGFKLNGKTFYRFIGTTGGLKNNTVLCVSNDVYDELSLKCECNRNKNVKLVPAKYEAYKALTFSSSLEIVSPNHILVVTDAITKFKDNIVQLDDTMTDQPTIEYIDNADLENNTSDGFNLCTIEYMQRIADKLGLDYIPSGVCLRNAWLKGMLYPFPISEFAGTYRSDNYTVTDIWGNEHDIREVDMILTESSLKLWSSYSSIEDYVESYKDNGFEFAVTKVVDKQIEDVRALNYQYLQSYELSDDDIVELCKPTVAWLKNSLCGNYKTTLEFLGIDEHSKNNDFAKALYLNEYMLKDPYVIDKVNKMISKKINNAKIGKLLTRGNYQLLSGDPILLMQHILGVDECGLLKKNEFYSSYWYKRNTKEVVAFRSPMSAHNNIRKVKLSVDKECQRWYRYMDNVFIVNGFDAFCIAESGCDWDGDTIYSSDDHILTTRYSILPAINCVQKSATKEKIKKSNVEKSNINGMGNKVGTITNRVSAMIDLLSLFDKNSKEHKELEYRILCGQLYQQAEIDKIKGIKSKPMPKHWYDYKSCDNDFDRRIVAHKKPYYFIYNYPHEKTKYNKFVQQNNIKCQNLFKKSLEELLSQKTMTEQEYNFIKHYNNGMTVILSNSVMNRICRYIEGEFNGYTQALKNDGEFDYTFLKTGRKCFNIHREEIKKYYDEYNNKLRSVMKNAKVNKLNKDDIRSFSNSLKFEFKSITKEICPNDDERLDIILDLCYNTNKCKQFCWDMVGDLIIKRLEDMNENRD